MAYCKTCNDLRPEGLPERNPSGQKVLKLFSVKQQVGNFKDTAEKGCRGCQLVFEAILSYVGSVALDKLATDEWDDKLVILQSNCNEPLNIYLAGLSQNVREDLGPMSVLELYEENNHKSPEQGTPLYAAIGYGTTPPKTLQIDWAAKLSAKWIERCNAQHECYQEDCPPPMPTRVLEVGEEGGIRLIITDRESRGPYVALSYCWGKSGNATTTSTNLRERMTGIDWSSLPSLIRDVVDFTRLIGVRYLWIDALCIIQDDKVDWRKESSQMGNIYAGAYFTISTDAAASTAQALTSPRNLELKTQMKYSEDGVSEELVVQEKVHRVNELAATVVDGRRHRFFAREHYSHWDIIKGLHDFEHRNAPLNSRGWTMQERLLSRRILHFGAHEMVWECKASADCECGGISHDFSWGQDRDTPMLAFDKAKDVVTKSSTLQIYASAGEYIRDPEFTAAWMRLVSMFTTRQLTHDTDRLPAMSALAQRLSEGKTYLAGMWCEDLPWHLAWRPLAPDSEKYKVKPYTGPSWSWVSNVDPINWWEWTRKARSSITILESFTDPMSFNLFGEVTAGMIKLKGRVAHGTLYKSRWDIVSVATPDGTIIDFLADVDSRPEHDSKRQRRNNSGQKNVHRLAPRAELWCIVLFDDDVEDSYWNIQKKCHWIMITARPSNASVRRGVPKSMLLQDTLVCERIGCIVSEVEKEDVRTTTSQWIRGPDFEEREVVLI